MTKALFSQTDCTAFIKNRGKNPVTGRSIKPYGRVYKQLKNSCDNNTVACTKWRKQPNKDPNTKQTLGRSAKFLWQARCTSTPNTSKVLMSSPMLSPKKRQQRKTTKKVSRPNNNKDMPFYGVASLDSPYRAPQNVRGRGTKRRDSRKLAQETKERKSLLAQLPFKPNSPIDRRPPPHAPLQQQKKRKSEAKQRRSLQAQLPFFPGRHSNKKKTCLDKKHGGKCDRVLGDAAHYKNYHNVLPKQDIIAQIQKLHGFDHPVPDPKVSKRYRRYMIDDGIF